MLTVNSFSMYFDIMSLCIYNRVIVRKFVLIFFEAFDYLSDYLHSFILKPVKHDFDILCTVYVDSM
jgi:hypothetical protein